MVVQTLEILQTSKRSTRGGAELRKEIYIPVFDVLIGGME